MVDVAMLIFEVEKFGGRLVAAGPDHLRLIGGANVPNWLRDAVRQRKADILAELLPKGSDALAGPMVAGNCQEFVGLFGKYPWQYPWSDFHPGRASLVPEVYHGFFYHWCSICGKWAPHGIGFNSRTGNLGRWFCKSHAPK